jgi:uncharacterized protein (TIGR03437 family)
VKLRLGGVELEVLYAGRQGQAEGLDQVNVRIPAGFAGRGALALEIGANGTSTAGGVTLTVVD